MSAEPPVRSRKRPRTLLIIVTGLSGSGKSVALRALEDLNFYCTDNLPAALLPAFARQIAGRPSEATNRAAVGIDARNDPGYLERIETVLAELEPEAIDCEVFYLQADDPVLLQRFSETRRRHPLTGRGVSLHQAIAREREILDPLAGRADLFVDTTRMTVHDLRHRIFTQIGARGEPMSLLLESFAYKRGVPRDIDLVFDARCVPNPHWDPDLRPLTGCDAPVRDYLEAQADAQTLYEDIRTFLERWLPRFEAEKRSYVTVGIGCTGGRHRSVYFAERLAAHFRHRRGDVLLNHRDL